MLREEVKVKMPITEANVKKVKRPSQLMTHCCGWHYTENSKEGCGLDFIPVAVLLPTVIK